MARTTLEDKIRERNELARGYLGYEDADLEDLNKGELLAFAMAAGLGAHRGLSKQNIIAILEGDQSPVSSPIDDVRDKMIAFIKLYWERIKSQLPEQCEGDCYACSDLKVLACFAENKENLFKGKRR